MIKTMANPYEDILKRAHIDRVRKEEDYKLKDEQRRLELMLKAAQADTDLFGPEARKRKGKPPPENRRAPAPPKPAPIVKGQLNLFDLLNTEE